MYEVFQNFKDSLLGILGYHIVSLAATHPLWVKDILRTLNSITGDPWSPLLLLATSHQVGDNQKSDFYGEF